MKDLIFRLSFDIVISHLGPTLASLRSAIYFLLLAHMSHLSVVAADVG